MLPTPAASAWWVFSKSCVIAHGSNPQLVRGGRDAIDLDEVIYIYGRTLASSVLSNIYNIHIIYII